MAAGEPAKQVSPLRSLRLAHHYLGLLVIGSDRYGSADSLSKRSAERKLPDAVSWYRPHPGDLACSHRADCPWTSFIRRGTEDESDRALCRRGRGGEGGILIGHFLQVAVFQSIMRNR